ncbi:fibulin-5-like [Stegostoma tigrinum]|uniref:fibulin-5-like n=1 Tax=Stegostoma tigrinum TaxID=3053191 RepID=UPI0028702BBC|nr:fibulin-5-like [Stegostoma tigrinum]
MDTYGCLWPIIVNGSKSVIETCSSKVPNYWQDKRESIVVPFSEDVDIDECATSTSNCEQNCANTIGSFTCSCLPGYSINVTNSSRCDDVDECVTNTSNCEQNCANTIGSFTCSCLPGYSINATNSSRCDAQRKVILRFTVSSEDVNLADQLIREEVLQNLQALAHNMGAKIEKKR